MFIYNHLQGFLRLFWSLKFLFVT